MNPRPNGELPMENLRFHVKFHMGSASFTGYPVKLQARSLNAALGTTSSEIAAATAESAHTDQTVM